MKNKIKNIIKSVKLQIFYPGQDSMMQWGLDDVEPKIKYPKKKKINPFVYPDPHH